MHRVVVGSSFVGFFYVNYRIHIEFICSEAFFTSTVVLYLFFPSFKAEMWPIFIFLCYSTAVFHTGTIQLSTLILYLFCYNQWLYLILVNTESSYTVINTNHVSVFRLYHSLFVNDYKFSLIRFHVLTYTIKLYSHNCFPTHNYYFLAFFFLLKLRLFRNCDLVPANVSFWVRKYCTVFLFYLWMFLVCFRQCFCCNVTHQMRVLVLTILTYFSKCFHKMTIVCKNAFFKWNIL